MHLLPALPEAWPNGQLRGRCGRGGFVVDLAWQAGQVTTATIHAHFDGPCRVRATGQLTITQDGARLATKAVAPEIVEFIAERGKEYWVKAEYWGNGD